MTSLMNSFNQLVTPDQVQTTVEPAVRKTGSLQEHLMSVSRTSVGEVTSSANELSVGPPPMYRKDAGSNVVGMSKKKGARVIFWSQVASKHQAA